MTQKPPCGFTLERFLQGGEVRVGGGGGGEGRDGGGGGWTGAKSGGYT